MNYDELQPDIAGYLRSLPQPLNENKRREHLQKVLRIHLEALQRRQADKIELADEELEFAAAAGGDEKQVFLCPYCGQKLISADKLAEHKRMFHD
jgi:hypothetical protein